MADSGERTEQPTPRRRDKARKEGRFLVSRELAGALQFTIFVVILNNYALTWTTDFGAAFQMFVHEAMRPEPLKLERLEQLMKQLMMSLATDFLPLASAMLAIALLGTLMTTQFGFALSKLAPDFNRLNPVQKLQNMPKQNIQTLVQTLVSLPLFGLVLYYTVSDALPVAVGLPSTSWQGGASVSATWISKVLWRGAYLLLLIGFIDLFKQWREYTKTLRMTKQEIRDESKETDGNPQIKSQVRRLQRDLLRRKMMAEVANATAVVVNPTHYAVALKYAPGDVGAPKVVAKGKNYLALRIKARAMEHQVPIIENPPLARALYSSAQVGQEIPPNLYRAVAEVLAYIYRLMNGRPVRN